MKRGIGTLALLLLLLAGCARETTSGAQVAEANQLYEAGRFTEATALFQTLVDAGVMDGTVYYNLGNAYFKAGDLGRAILNYRRAQRLLPRDPDVAANLQLARTQTRDQLEVEDRSALVVLTRRVLVEWTTLDEAASLALGVWVVECALAVAAILWPQGRGGLRYGIIVVGALLGLSVLSVGIRVLDARGRIPAIVVAEAADVRSGPAADYLLEFTLHAGAEVRILENREGWVRVALPGDLQGWMPGEALETL